MLSRSCVWLSPRKWVYRLFQAEQLSTNSTLDGLSAIQKRKVIMKIFKALPKDDLSNLKVRAVGYQARVEAGDRNPLAPAATGSPGAAGVQSYVEITPYEFFVMEQRGNPAISSLPSPRAQEVKLLEIYNSLPEKAREALEQRAGERNAQRKLGKAGATTTMQRQRRRSRPAATRRKKRHAAAKPANQQNIKNERGVKVKATAKHSASTGSSKREKKQPKVKRAASPYAIFVKEQMPTVQNLPLKDRMREISNRWHALSDTECAARLSQSKTAKAAEAKASKSSAHATAGNSPSDRLPAHGQSPQGATTPTHS